jgi:hypothetical protein
MKSRNKRIRWDNRPDTCLVCRLKLWGLVPFGRGSRHAKDWPPLEGLLNLV